MTTFKKSYCDLSGWVLLVLMAYALLATDATNARVVGRLRAQDAHGALQTQGDPTPQRRACAEPLVAPLDPLADSRDTNASRISRGSSSVAGGVRILGACGSVGARASTAQSQRRLEDGRRATRAAKERLFLLFLNLRN